MTSTRHKLDKGVSSIFRKTQALFSPPGMPAQRAIYFADVIFSLYLMVDLEATSSRELLDESSPNFQ